MRELSTSYVIDSPPRSRSKPGFVTSDNFNHAKDKDTFGDRSVLMNILELVAEFILLP